MSTVFVITPVGPDVDPDHLYDCNKSVATQEGVDTIHIMVADGVLSKPTEAALDDLDLYREEQLERIDLPQNTGDIGSTPRTVGAAYAWGIHADWVAFLDADCRYLPSHLSQLIDYQRKTEKPIVCSGRIIESHCGKFREPCPEMVPGSEFYDTNTFLFRRSPEAVRASYTYGCLLTREQHKVGDRILSAEARPWIGCHYRPTVVYRTCHQFHYDRWGWPVPDGLKLKNLSKPA